MYRRVPAEAVPHNGHALADGLTRSAYRIFTVKWYEE